MVLGHYAEGLCDNHIFALPLHQASSDSSNHILVFVSWFWE